MNRLSINNIPFRNVKTLIYTALSTKCISM